MAKTGTNEILALLVKVDGAVSITSLCTQLGLKGTARDDRRPVIKSIAKLIQRGFAKRTTKLGLRNAIEAEYTATDEGRKFVADGGRIVSGVQKGPRRGAPKVDEDSARQRIWMAFRRLRKATLPAIVEVARIGDEDAANLMNNARKLLKALAACGVVVELRDREGGFSPTSNGFKRYALHRDLGRLAPVVGARNVYDPNARERIAYLTKKGK